ENYQEKLEAYNKNREVYNILMESTGNTSYESIKLGDISKMDTGNVTLANIIDAPTSDEKVEKPLDPDAPDYQEQLDKYNAYNQNRKLYDILLDSAGIKFTSCEDYKKLKVNSLNDFDVQSIKLSTVMGSSSNSIIQSLIDEDNAHVNEEDYVPVTLGTIGDRINGLLVKDVYNVEVFTTDVNKANFSNIKYNETDMPYYKTEDEEGNVTYSTTGSGEEYYVIGYYKTVDFNGIVRYVTEKPEGGDDTLYYISKDSSVWLFMLFDSFDIDQSKFDDTTGQLVYKGTGVAETYIEKNITIKGLKDRISVVSVNIMNASVRQICDCGMLDGEYDKIYGLSFVEAIKELNRLMSLMG
ncbi:MAG: hypothetical protein J6R83_03445, partial [Clostridia bacterium]|nr:hypothetical protein [Clostridia bacterium]